MAKRVLNQRVINQRTLDIIIPVKDRSTVLRCVSTLLAEIAQCEEIVLGKILVCDGGSQSHACQHQLQQVAQLPQVKVLAFPHEGFNKSWLMNQGLAAATAPLILISDVDILWNQATLNQLGLAAARHPDRFYCVQTVNESEPSAKAPQRPRYTYSIEQAASGQSVNVYAAAPPLSPTSSTHHPSRRPGCGLLCGQRRLFQQVGGYRHCFQGWGWEDQDLLIRAQLLGYAIAELGNVVHLSHGDNQRNQNNKQQAPVQSRDANILRCLEGIAQGKLQGDLAQFDPEAAISDDSHPEELELGSQSSHNQSSHSSITVHYPHTLAPCNSP